MSAEATPHHLLLSEEDVRDPASGEPETARKMNPPLAPRPTAGRWWRRCAAGTIECVATDHAPHAAPRRRWRSARAPMGTTGLETAFAALYTGLVLPGVLDLGDVDGADDGGAALFGLPMPTIAVGGRGEPDAGGPRRGVDGGRARLGEPLGE